MKLRSRPLFLVFAICISIALSVPEWRTAAFDLAASYSGYARIDGALQLEVSVSPPVVMPGQNISLDATILNQNGDARSPEISFSLPDGLNVDANALPSGVTLNMQTNALNWLPEMSGSGDSELLNLRLRVETADISSPEKTIEVNMREGEQISTAELPIWIGIAPQIKDFLTPRQVAVGQPVTLRVSVDGSGPVAQTWDLGDGRLVEVNEPEVVFPSPGIYQLSLEVANPLTAVTAQHQISIVPHPAAQFTADDDTPGADQVVRFQNQSGGQPPLSLLWDFGDGTVSDAVNPEHQYAQPGAYLVHLLVQNQYGQSEAYTTVTVGSSPTADLIFPESGPAGDALPGQAFGDESVTSYLWDMGDGQTESGQQIQHVYRQPGDYYVSMTAFNDFGSTQVGRWLQIRGGILPVYLPVVMQADIAAADLMLLDPDGMPFGVSLEAVDLDEPFIMEPIELPTGLSRSDQLFAYVNEARRIFELPPLARIHELNLAAQEHADDMAVFRYTAHLGSDGSYPVERLIWTRYAGGYAGEATAWGFEYPYQAVEFWVNSPAHRRIILNRYATDLGVGYTVDYTAPNVWYWTAEFGNAQLALPSPAIRLDQPESEAMPALDSTFDPKDHDTIADLVEYSWNWQLPLTTDQRFIVYMFVNGRAKQLGTVAAPELGTRFSLPAAAYPTVLAYQRNPALYTWQVRLENESGFVFAESERRTILLVPDPDLPTPVPSITPTAVPSATATPMPTMTPTNPPPAPQATSTPIPTPPMFVTATPRP